VVIIPLVSDEGNGEKISWFEFEPMRVAAKLTISCLPIYFYKARLEKNRVG
jgi:hypothetical protein